MARRVFRGGRGFRCALLRSCGHSLGICSNLDNGTTYLEKIPRLYEQKESLIIAIHYACKSLCLR